MVTGNKLPDRRAFISRGITRDPIRAILLQRGTRIVPPHDFDQGIIMRLETTGLEVTLVTC
jgi:hypothetical protein